MIDVPIIGLVNGLNTLPYCFTMQSCYGHFSCNGQKEAYDLKSFQIVGSTAKVEYRIAYVALCIENSALGRRLFEALKELETVNPEYIQFCSAEWFWERQVNSFALQVEPDRFKRVDKAVLDFKEALYVEKIRNETFANLNEVLDRCKQERLMPM